MKRFTAPACALAAALAFAGLAGPAAAATLEVPGIGLVPIQNFTVTIVSVNPDTREVIVKARNGNQFAYRIAPYVGPLTNLEKNEEVAVSVVPGTVSDLEKAKSGTAGFIAQELLDTSIFTSLPQNYFATSITANVTLVAVDPVARTVTFEGADGQVRTMPAANDEAADDLARVQPGDLCQITYVEAMAFDVKE
jgi:hypothetical protein